ncbi:unnamed protein product [Prorocentrum cordatum]|uniref:Uncharacterized protein n=1 Tax=Prorocentrum cordatum TaxID=2364126 RepID=A0ABN9WZR1_9DINO|nr:unnamed protein product [Polarella glacialis]
MGIPSGHPGAPSSHLGHLGAILVQSEAVPLLCIGHPEVEDLVALGVKRGPAVKLAAHVKSMMPAMVSEPAGAPALAGAVVAGAAGAVVAPPTAVAEEGMGVDAGLPGGGCPAAAESLEASALPADSVMVAQVPAAPSTAAMGAAPPTPLSGSPGGPLSASPGGPPDGAVGAAVQADAGGPAAPALEPGQQAATGVAQETSGPFTEQRILNYLHAGRSAKDLISAGADKAAVLLALQSDDTLCSEGNWSGQDRGFERIFSWAPAPNDRDDPISRDFVRGFKRAFVYALDWAGDKMMVSTRDEIPPCGSTIQRRRWRSVRGRESGWRCRRTRTTPPSWPRSPGAASSGYGFDTRSSEKYVFDVDLKRTASAMKEFLSLAWSPDSKHIALNNRADQVYILNLQTAGSLKLGASKDMQIEVNQMVWGPEGETLWVATGGIPGKIHVLPAPSLRTESSVAVVAHQDKPPSA